MKVLFVASELTPIVKVGGLGDVMGALPKALNKLGIDVSVIIPRYGFIPKEKLRVVARGIEVNLTKQKETVDLFETRIPGTRVKVFLVENADYWTHSPEPYFEQTAFAGAKKEIQRFAFFSKAVFELLRAGNISCDVLHANDWHTGALVSLVAHHKTKSENFKKIKTVFTIHNLSNQGIWNANEIDHWFFAPGDRKIFQNINDNYNFLAEGILRSDWVTTVSPAYAREILTEKYGNGLENIVKQRKNNLTGIINGIDYDFFNPSKDKYLVKRFTPRSVRIGKLENKKEIVKQIGFADDATPIFGLVSRLTEQKGIDFLISFLPMFAGKHRARFLFLGQGSKIYERALTELSKKFPMRIFAKIGFDEKLAHQIYAASDFFLMPSRFEPSGLGQMIAMRYGSIPIVRKTGGLADTVKNMKTGFVFEKASSFALASKIEKAIRYFNNKKELLNKIQNNCLRENFDFLNSARAYEKLYKKLIK